jgi:hypothetical protein
VRQSPLHTDRRHRRLPVFLALLLLVPTGAPAAMRTADWPALWAELGPFAVSPLLGHLYAGDWDRWSVTADYILVDFVQHQPHWQNLFPGNLPTLAGGPGLALAVAPAPRWRLATHGRWIPLLDAGAVGLDGAFQILSGSSDSSAFFLGLGSGLVVDPGRYRLWLPRLFLEWSNEFVRGDARGARSPWTGLISARLDQSYRFAEGLGGLPDNRDVMATLLRAGIHVRRGNLRFGYDFGLQQGGLFTHALAIQAIWGAPLRAWLEAPRETLNPESVSEANR